MNADNAYWVLSLSLDATPAEAERQGRKILGMLELGKVSAKEYTCPLGTFARDATMVREAIAAFRDPKVRARHRCLASLIAPDRAPVSWPAAPDDALPEAVAIRYRGL